MKNLLFSVLALFFLAGCQEKKTPYIHSDNAKVLVEARQEHPGKKLMETYCYACHSPRAPMNEGRIAPPMAAVKMRYLKSSRGREEFIEQIVHFVEEPTIEKSRMPGAIKKFGVMPSQQFPDDAVEKIAEYLYGYEVEEPEWFSDHKKGGPGKGNFGQQGHHLENRMGKGIGMRRPNHDGREMEIAMETKKLLGQNLMSALQEEGTTHALEFCNEEAIPLTTSMAEKYKASVQRISDKPRNPANEASTEEAELINYFKAQVNAGKDPQPILIPQNGSTRFYYPIVTNSMCLQCHGKPADIEPQVREKILKLYPQDKAVGYSENEVRGLWKIEF